MCVEEATLDKNSFAIDDRAVLNHPAARAALSNLVPIISVFARDTPRHKEAVIVRALHYDVSVRRGEMSLALEVSICALFYAAIVFSECTR